MTARKTRKELGPGRGFTKEHRDAVDGPEATDEQPAQARLFAGVFPEPAAEIRKNVGGRPKSANPKQAISIRLDRDVIAAFKARGEGWQSRINEALRKAAGLS